MDMVFLHIYSSQIKINVGTSFKLFKRGLHQIIQNVGDNSQIKFLQFFKLLRKWN
jgi:hypothetical protein